MEEEPEDPADRLIIDETSDNSNTKSKEDNRSEDGEEVPQCQGCQQKAAQFVCAGCGNQWYCSRDCQVLPIYRLLHMSSVLYFLLVAGISMGRSFGSVFRLTYCPSELKKKHFVS